mmetsp:Transcript_21292/g.23130  ORF Transcript_21292/g.23130 Transcript_21292/m.23130 type:complete len:117 (-) Transcript_21292:117-467(-)
MRKEEEERKKEEEKRKKKKELKSHIIINDESQNKFEYRNKRDEIVLEGYIDIDENHLCPHEVTRPYPSPPHLYHLHSSLVACFHRPMLPPPSTHICLPDSLGRTDSHSPSSETPPS